MVKNSPANSGDLREEGVIPGLERSPEGSHGNPHQYSCLENSHGQSSLVGYGLWVNLPARQETWVRSLGQEDPLEKETATHSSILAWKIPWMEERGGLQSMGLQRVRHD